MISAQRIGALYLIAATGVFALGCLTTAELVSDVIIGVSDRWSLPGTPIPQSNSELGTLDAMFEHPASTGSSSAPAVATSPWKIVAIVHEGSGVYAVVIDEGGAAGQTLRRLHVGDVLPSGERIIAIKSTSLIVAGEAGERRISIF